MKHCTIRIDKSRLYILCFKYNIKRKINQVFVSPSVFFLFCIIIYVLLENDVKTLGTFVRGAQRHESGTASSAQRPLLTLLVLESSLLIVPRRCGPIPPVWSGRAQTKITE